MTQLHKFYRGNKLLHCGILNYKLKVLLSRKSKKHWSNRFDNVVTEEFETKLKAEVRAAKLNRKIK